MKFLEKHNPEEYLDNLPTITKAFVLERSNEGVDYESIAIQLCEEPGRGMQTKGGDSWPTNMWQRFKDEMHKLFCTDSEEYSEIRGKLEKEGSVSLAVMIGLVSAAVSATVGLAPALCAPFVILFLASIVKAGKRAWCEKNSK